MRKKPHAVLFDALGTLFALDPVRHALITAGLPDGALELAMARTLRDGFALEATGQFRKFTEIFSSHVRDLSSDDLEDDAMEKISAAFERLPAFPDVLPAIRALRESGIRVGILTNGSETATRRTMDFNGLSLLIGEVTSIEHVFRWKPTREAYHHAARALGEKISDLALVSAHPWDVYGAHQAGLMTGFIRRDEGYPETIFTRADAASDSLLDLVRSFGAESAAEQSLPLPNF